MRLRSASTLVFSSAAVLAFFVACSGSDLHPAPGGDADGGGKGISLEAGGGTDSGFEAGVAASITHLSTVCGSTACGIMGIKKSGFQELADVSFVVKDADGKPARGVPVKFELESPPTGTDFLTGTMSAPTVVTIRRAITR